MAHEPVSSNQHHMDEATFQAAQTSDGLARKVFLLTLVGAVAWCAVVLIFVI